MDNATGAGHGERPATGGTAVGGIVVFGARRDIIRLSEDEYSVAGTSTSMTRDELSDLAARHGIVLARGWDTGRDVPRAEATALAWLDPRRVVAAAAIVMLVAAAVAIVVAAWSSRGNGGGYGMLDLRGTGQSARERARSR